MTVVLYTQKDDFTRFKKDETLLQDWFNGKPLGLIRKDDATAYTDTASNRCPCGMTHDRN